MVLGESDGWWYGKAVGRTDGVGSWKVKRGGVGRWGQLPDSCVRDKAGESAGLAEYWPSEALQLIDFGYTKLEGMGRALVA